MSFAPPSLLAARALIRKHVPQLSAIELGIVGDDSHANSGTSYHLGKDALRPTSYSIIESDRDRNGLSNAASALDIGYFSITVDGRKWTLRDMSTWIVGQCADGSGDTRDVREVIYSPDGKVVKRWDRLKIRSSGDDSHLTHTHISWFRDSENRDKTSIFARWFQHIGAIEKEDDVTEAEIIAAVTKVLQSAAGQAAMREAVGAGVHGQRLGRSDVTFGVAAQETLALVKDLAARPTATPVVTKEAIRDAMIDIITHGFGE